MAVGTVRVPVNPSVKVVGSGTPSEVKIVVTGNATVTGMVEIGSTAGEHAQLVPTQVLLMVVVKFSDILIVATGPTIGKEMTVDTLTGAPSVMAPFTPQTPRQIGSCRFSSSLVEAKAVIAAASDAKKAMLFIVKW